MKKFAHRFLYKKERGQAIIMIAFGIIGLVSMVGLVIDTGILFIEYGKLKRGVDAAAIAAAQEFRAASGGVADPTAMRNAAINYLLLNDTNVDLANINVHSCAEAVGLPTRPKLCNPDPVGNPIANRKLVELSASKFVSFSFLRVLGIKGTTISTSAIGEAAAMDLVLIMDTSSSMSYETSGLGTVSDPGDDPHLCNKPWPNDTCQPMKAIKIVAQNFIDTMYFPYDRVAIVTMTGQEARDDAGGPPTRDARILLPLTSVKSDVITAIQGLKVFDPRKCSSPYANTPGPCAFFNGANYNVVGCEIWELQKNAGALWPDASSCNSSDVGSTLDWAAQALTAGTGNAASRSEAFWAVVGLYGGPANSSSTAGSDYAAYRGTFPYGFCPKTTWVPETTPLKPQRNLTWCIDRLVGEGVGRRHSINETVNYVNPRDGNTYTVPAYDADDFARDRADRLATTISGGVTIYTIGLGAQVQDTSMVDNGELPPAENLLQYIAEAAGGVNVSHGKYFYAPNSASLGDIFELIANNIATRISQ
jgi:hypothetical protein